MSEKLQTLDNICDECNGSLIKSNGFIVCKDCGICYDYIFNNVVEVNENKYNERIKLISFNSKRNYQLNKIINNNINYYISYQNKLLHISKLLNIPQVVYEDAWRILKTSINKGLLKKRRKREIFIFAAIQIASSINNYYIPISETLNNYNLKKNTISKAELIIKIGLEDKLKHYFIQENNKITIRKIDYFCNLLNVKSSDEVKILEEYNKIKKHITINKGVISALIFKNTNGLTQSEISKKLQMSQSTIKKYLKILENKFINY